MLSTQIYSTEEEKRVLAVIAGRIERTQSDLICKAVDDFVARHSKEGRLEALRGEQDWAAGRWIGLQKGEYFLITDHRVENVDVPGRLSGTVSALNRLAWRHGVLVVWSVYPWTRQCVENVGLELDARILESAILDLFNLAKLEKNAFCVLIDSGILQE